MDHENRISVLEGNIDNPNERHSTPIFGTFGQHNNIYDDGEATYYLPLFDHEDRSMHGNGRDNYGFWFRNISIKAVAYIGSLSGIGTSNSAGNAANRVLIYVR